MKNKYILIISLLLLVNVACKTTATTKQKNEVKKGINIPNREHTIQALLWQQNSAEYKALCHQAYKIAKIEIDQISQRQYKRPIAIVTDIDETVLDNSPYNARMVNTDTEYTRETWIAWGEEEEAKAIPGSIAFFNYVKSKGINIYYLSNRYYSQKTETINNLKKLGFPNVDETHVLLRKETSSKKPRRELIEKTHQIVMLLGDNLSDFSEEFENQPTQKRNKIVEEIKSEIGTKFIVFPNPMYGDWETKGIYEGNYKWTSKQKDSIRKIKIRLN